MAIIITFLASLTILSSLLVIFSSVTPTSSWLVLLISLLGTLIIKKTNKQINNETIEQLNNYNNTKSYILHTTFYILLCVAIFLFYSHYQSTGSSPLVWNILPGWFLPALFILIVLSVIFPVSKQNHKITKTKKQNNNVIASLTKQSPSVTPNLDKSSAEDLSDPEIKNKQKQAVIASGQTSWEEVVERSVAISLDAQNEITSSKTSRNDKFFFFSFLNSSVRWNDVTIFLSFPIIFLILPILFPLGTDYDPFVHRAAEHTIVEQGSISPRTFLYSGEYGLVSILSTVTHIPVKTVNIWLLPILCLLFLPPILKKTFHNPSVLLAFFLLPFSLLTTTVPQGLGIFFLLLLLLLTWKFSQQTTINSQQNKLLFTVYCLLLAVASFLSHPFPGIAAFIFLGFSILPKVFLNLKLKINNLKLLHATRYTLHATFLFISSLLLPLALYLNNYLPSQFSISSISFNPASISALKTLFDFGWIRYTDPLSFVYFLGKNYEFFFLLIVLIPLLYNLRKESLRTFSNSNMPNASFAEENVSYQSAYIKPYLFSFLSILISSLLILFFLQPNVTSAEHIQLFTRVFSISLVFLWPLFLQGILLISQQTTINSQQNKLLFTVYCLLLAVLTVSNIYLQFPHSDRLEAHKGFLVSQDDITTVQKIESFAQKPYLVLANQTVGAAALDQFGFTQYVNQQTTVNKQQEDVTLSLSKGYNNEKQFFYSIPVSSRAQEYYLEMLNNPSQELINEIFRTYDIQELYLILNDYWKNSRIISRNLSATTNQTLTAGGNTIFKFLPSNSLP